ncbi:ADP-ribosylation factor-like protein 2-binding protein [Phlyctochytrium bullatum]|nr:ADP-ribosylation factor-like protein 2-binding protein [Phlyctochytrium bullatum]
MALWQASTTVPKSKLVHDDDDWDTDPSFVNNVSEKDQRWGKQKTLDLDDDEDEPTGQNALQIRDNIVKMHSSAICQTKEAIEQRKREYQKPGVSQNITIIFAYHSPVDPEDTKFDEVVGALEEVLMDDNFVSLQNQFLEKHYHHFENDDENKLIYMNIFSDYTRFLEKYTKI